jgi:DNA-binding CsgD family transcriptional regulator
VAPPLNQPDARGPDTGASNVSSILPAAVFVLSRDGRLEHMSSLARALTAEGEDAPVVVRGDRIGFRGIDDAGLAAAVEACRRERTSVLCAPGLRVRVAALRADSRDVFGVMRGAVVICVSGTRVESLARRQFMCRRFAATRAEAVVADLVAGGASVPAIAARLRRSPATVRSHVKSLFIKTGAASQRQLAAIVRQGILPPSP